jgi:hypothetical protein
MIKAMATAEVHPSEAAEPSPPAGTVTALDRLARARLLLGRERAEAPALLTWLLVHPAGSQEDLVRQDRRLHTWGVCERLLRRSEEVAPTDPDESGRLAALGLVIAERLEGRHPEPVLQDLRARAWAGLGEARLQAGQLRGAEEAVRAGAGCLAHGTGDLLIEARLLEFEAGVRLDQGRRSEAAALLQQAASRYLAVNQPELLERALLRRNQIRRQTERFRFSSHLIFQPIV